MRLIEHNPFTGITEYQDYDPLTGAVSIHRSQDVTDILEANLQMRNDEDYSKQGIKREWWHVLNVPNIVQYEMLSKFGLDISNKDHLDRIFKILTTDPDYSYLKVTSGNIGKRIKWE